MLIKRPKKKLGQVFLVNEHIAEIEAAHAEGKNVIEIGPGRGILTKKLCEKAKLVIAVEKDRELYSILAATTRLKNLKLINADFFKAGDDLLKEIRIDIMISNVPYNLSSKTIDFLIGNRLQAVLCLQKEFVQHMLAEPNTSNYSRLSVMSHLCMRVTKIMDVKRGNFNPVPKVDSSIIYLKPLKVEISEEESDMINLLMQHKKKTLRNAFIDSRHSLGIAKEDAISLSERLEKKEERPFSMSPEAMLDAAREAISLFHSKE